MTFSEKLTTLRVGRGWSQEKLAGELGVTRQAVGRWERGSGLPDANSLMALARVFDVDAEWLLDDGAEEAEPRRGVRSRFTMTDRAWAAILAAGALYSAAYSAVVLHDMEGLAQLLLSSGHTYRLIMTIQYFNLAVLAVDLLRAGTHGGGAVLPLCRHPGARRAGLAQAHVLPAVCCLRSYVRPVNYPARDRV